MMTIRISAYGLLFGCVVVASSVTAEIPFTVTTAATPTGGGTVLLLPEQAPYFYGANIDILALPASGFAFSDWTFDGGVGYNPADLTSISTTVVVIGNTTITANFAPTPEPATMGLLAVGLAALAARRKRAGK